MKKKILVAGLGIALFFVTFHFWKGPKKIEQNVAIAALAKLPISFIQNQGQIDFQIKFYVQGHGHAIAFAKEEIDYSSDVKQKFVGANANVKVEGLKKAEGKVNYLIGKDEKKWKKNIATYDEISYKNLYPGIDLVFSGTQGKLKSEYRVAAGADYKKILVAYNGIDGMRVSDAGDLVIQSKAGEIKDLKPYIYQEINGKKVEVAGKYVVDQNRYHFEVGAYDSRQVLVIDPTLIYSTYLGGGEDDEGWAIAVDATGNAYVAGRTNSSNFPIASPLQTTNPIRT